MNWSQLDLQAFLEREFRPLVWSGMLCCALSIFFITIRIQHLDQIADLTKQRDEMAQALEMTVKQASLTIQGNAICQYYGVLDLNQSAIEVVSVRQHPDSIHALFAMLQYKGWRFESESQFKQEHLPLTWAEDLNQLMVQKAAQSQSAEEASNRLNAYNLQAESERVHRCNLVAWCLGIFMAIMYPLRWIYQYHHLLN
jgi:hypothetical protein